MTLLLVTGLLAGCGGSDTTAETPPRADRGLPVEIFRAAPLDLSRSVSVAAPVTALRHVEVASQMSGVVTELTVEEGDAVTEGQVLARLDVREVEAELRRGRAQLNEQEVNVGRLEQLRERGYVDAASLSIARTQLEVARAEVGLWETRVSFGTVRAPMDGVVTARQVDPGEAVSQYAPLLALADFDRLVVRFGLSELDVAGLSPGLTVPVQIDAAGGGTRYDGTLRRIMPATETGSGLVTVEVVLPEATREAVRLGYLARTTLTVDRLDAALAVPIGAVGLRQGAHYVMVVDADNRLQRRDVSVGVSRGNWREITNGLTAGEAVITSSPADLLPGEAVRIVRELTPESAAA